MAFFNDNPVETDAADCLDMKKAADKVADSLCAVKPPFVLGIHGDWGSGKTSFLRLLQRSLARAEPVPFVVFFEPWRYQFEGAPAVALLQAIRTQLSLGTTLLDKAGKVANVTVFTALSLIDRLIAGVPGGIAGVARAEGERIERANGEELLGADSLRSLFETAIQQILAATGSSVEGRLVVLVDDLDRCGDDATVRLLEAFKLYFNVPNAIFVVAADPRAVERAVGRVQFKDQEKERIPFLSREYCSKLIQVVWELPLPRDIPGFIRRQMPDPLGEAIAQLQTQHGFLPPNPRQIKRFLGELRARLRAAEVGPDARLFPAVVAVQSLQTFHPDLYRILLYHPVFFESLQRLASDPNWVERPTVLKDYRIPAQGAERKEWDLPSDPRLLLCASLIAGLDLTDTDLATLTRWDC